MAKISIITNKAVDKTFEGVDCLLLRTLTETLKKGNVKRYTIKTERCNYVKVENQILDEDMNPLLNEDGTPQIETSIELQTLGQKDGSSIRVFSFDEINGLYEMIKDQIPSDLTKMQTENIEEQIALLVITQQDEPWSTVASDWEILS